MLPFSDELRRPIRTLLCLLSGKPGSTHPPPASGSSSRRPNLFCSKAQVSNLEPLICTPRGERVGGELRHASSRAEPRDRGVFVARLQSGVCRVEMIEVGTSLLALLRMMRV